MKVLIVDDDPTSRFLLVDSVSECGYEVSSVSDGQSALEAIESNPPDLVLLDVMMPGMDGYEVCRRVKDNPKFRDIPILFLTSLDEIQNKTKGFQLGAVDYITKPFEVLEVVARLKTHLALKQVREDLKKANQELSDLNQNLEERVEQKTREIEKINFLKKFFSPQLIESFTTGQPEEIMKSHRRNITVVFLDLRGFTSFVHRNTAEETMAVLSEYHKAIGPVIFDHEATLERFTGDGIMVFIGDPVPRKDHAIQAAKMTLQCRIAMRKLKPQWEKRGHKLHDVGIGIATGEATLGKIGYEKRVDYAAIGNVTNLAARLCGEAPPGHILIAPSTLKELDNQFRTEEFGALQMKGFPGPIMIHHLLDE